ncbi:SHOCT domain-containing protein [Thalassotalea euphylliae]|uniref:SHOCT domain-containing protein n=1 Tax=Thalassotalea euphylliae TaxID=1655234 RepID=A0A3E0U3Z3_9GAMM|nr:SHOCT domain-containing protein [Thalassotalea euphylliae]REL31460.1 SHOCT domain-containing protein [Thalassotalea euphylliae]
MNTLRIIIFLAFYFLLVAWSSSAELSFKPFATLPKHIAEQVIAIYPTSKYDQHFIVASASGELFILNASKGQPELTPLNHNLLTENDNSRLLAIALHPNFDTREQNGYHKFYSAHQVAIDQANTKASRIVGRQFNKDSLEQDIVLKEWQLSDSINLEEVTVREVLRIGLPTSNTAKVQLAFNPYHRAWDDNFGLLYVGLSAIKGFATSPLYSGSILRIKPEQFGLKPYTVPPTNPYVENAEINQEIYRFRLSQLGHFTWPDRVNETLWIDHQDEQTHKISRASNPLSTVFRYKNLEISEFQILPYYGNQADQLFGSTLVVSVHQDQPYLVSLTKHASSNDYQLTPIIPLGVELPVKLFHDAVGGVLMYQPSTGILSRLVNNLADSKETLVTDSNTGLDKLIVFLIMLSLTSWGLWHTYRKINKRRFSVTSFYQQQFNHLELSNDDSVIHLFKPHQSVPSKSLAIGNLAGIKLLINNISVVELSHQQGMTNDFDNIWRQTCNVEKREKMTDGKLRHIQLAITDNERQIYLVSLYLRKGDNRISKASYQAALINAVDWAWRLSTLVAPETTEQRETSSDVIIDKSRPIKTRKTFLNCSALANTKASSALSGDNTINVSDKDKGEKCSEESKVETKAKQIADTNHEQKTDVNDFHLLSTANTTEESRALAENNGLTRGQTDAQIILALEKLVSLKKQNYLTEEEFEQAKAKLLNGLM